MSAGGHGQFIPIHFSAIDQAPEWNNFMAAEEFAVWAILVRYIWRSTTVESHLGLHRLYEAGILSAAVTIEKLVTHFCGRRSRSAIMRDLKKLEERKVIERHAQTKPTIYILGGWEMKQVRGTPRRVYVEWLYAQTYLGVPSQENAPDGPETNHGP